MGNTRQDLQPSRSQRLAVVGCSSGFSGRAVQCRALTDRGVRGPSRIELHCSRGLDEEINLYELLNNHNINAAGVEESQFCDYR